ncbi:ERF family protein [Winogradskyella sp.]|nr:ERF family protein [Winogradskyella sp.]
MEQLIRIQAELKAPKNQRNNFGKYNYRSCEDILEAVKPLLSKENCTLVISDEIKELGGLIYCESKAIINNGTNEVCVTAQAGIDPNRKGMDIAQSFGSSSSYARKYALNGLFLIDDTKDADATNTHGKEESKQVDPALLYPEIKMLFQEKANKISADHFPAIEKTVNEKITANYSKVLNHLKAL